MASVRLHVRVFHKHTDLYWCAREPLSLRVRGLYIWFCTVCLLKVQKNIFDRGSAEVSAQTIQKSLVPVIKVVE